jgi:hypothetical protein
MTDSHPRNVWIFARPLSGTRWFPVTAKSSTGKFHLCHWGILVSEVTVMDVRAISLGRMQNWTSTENVVLGTMYELERLGDKNTVHISRSFGTLKMNEEWRTVSAEYVGDTAMSDVEISTHGMSTLGALTLSFRDNRKSSRLRVIHGQLSKFWPLPSRGNMPRLLDSRHYSKHS